ncbi:MAG: hypothetical protein L6425_06720 [Candidatus Aminicenantes bacterium]|nr:hypothetical protein [Candidatus Aminicenantes bacterium]
MGIADDVKNLGEDIVASYNARITAVGTIVKDTRNMLKGFHAEHKEMSEKLRADMAKGEEDRLAGFKVMMAEIKKFVSDIVVDGTAKLMKQIQTEQKARNKAVADLLEKFAKDHEAMADELKKSLAKGETDRLEDFKKMMEGIQKYVADVVKETKRLMDAIRARQDERNKEVLDLLEAFKTEREKMAANWQNLVATMAKKRGVEPVEVEAGAEVKTVEEVKVRPVEKPIEEIAVEEMPPEEEVKVRPVEEANEEVAEEEMPPEMSLEERVLEFINRHSKGVRVGEMEEPLGVVRTRLGAIAKKLLNEGKVRKEEKLYFPL